MGSTLVVTYNQRLVDEHCGRTGCSSLIQANKSLDVERVNKQLSTVGGYVHCAAGSEAEGLQVEHD